jgi:hypothetical protein
MPRTDINEEEFLACARYGLMLAEQNEDDASDPAESISIGLDYPSTLFRTRSPLSGLIAARKRLTLSHAGFGTPNRKSAPVGAPYILIQNNSGLPQGPADPAPGRLEDAAKRLRGGRWPVL